MRRTAAESTPKAVDCCRREPVSIEVVFVKASSPSPEAEERKNGNDDNDKSYDVNDLVHAALL